MRPSPVLAVAPDVANLIVVGATAPPGLTVDLLRPRVVVIELLDADVFFVGDDVGVEAGERDVSWGRGEAAGEWEGEREDFEPDRERESAAEMGGRGRVTGFKPGDKWVPDLDAVNESNEFGCVEVVIVRGVEDGFESDDRDWTDGDDCDLDTGGGRARGGRTGGAAWGTLLLRSTLGSGRGETLLLGDVATETDDDGKEGVDIFLGFKPGSEDDASGEWKVMSGGEVAENAVGVEGSGSLGGEGAERVWTEDIEDWDTWEGAKENESDVGEPTINMSVVFGPLNKAGVTCHLN